MRQHSYTRGSVVYGHHVLMSKLKENPESIKVILIDKDRKTKRLNELAKLATDKNVSLEFVASHNLDMTADGEKHYGAIAYVNLENDKSIRLETLLSTKDNPLLLVLDGVTDGRNLGACFRVAEAFGVDAIIVPKNRSASLSSGVLKAASGSADRVNFIQVTNLARALSTIKSKGIRIVGFSNSATFELPSCELNMGVALVFGGEGQGLRRLSRELCDDLVVVPMCGQVESLNISVAVGIALYECWGQRFARKR